MSPPHDNKKPSDILTPLLLKCGLSEPEAVIYRTLLGKSPQPAARVARLAGLKRGQTYNLLALLSSKGLVSQREFNTVRHFEAAPPQVLLQSVREARAALEHSEHELETCMPLLEQFIQREADVPAISFFRGVSGVKALYEDTLEKENTSIYSFCDFAALFRATVNEPELNEWIERYSEKRAERNIVFYGIVNKSSVSDTAYRKRKQHKRVLKEAANLPFPVEVNIYGRTVSFLSSKSDFFGLRIEDEAIAETFKMIHRVLWDTLPDYSLKRKGT